MLVFLFPLLIFHLFSYLCFLTIAFLVRIAHLGTVDCKYAKFGQSDGFLLLDSSFSVAFLGVYVLFLDQLCSVCEYGQHWLWRLRLKC